MIQTGFLKSHPLPLLAALTLFHHVQTRTIASPEPFHQYQLHCFCVSSCAFLPCSGLCVRSSAYIVARPQTITIDIMHKLYCARCTIRRAWCVLVRVVLRHGSCPALAYVIVVLFFCPWLCVVFFCEVLIITSRVCTYTRSCTRAPPGATPDLTRPGFQYIYFPLAIFLTKPS